MENNQEQLRMLRAKFQRAPPQISAGVPTETYAHSVFLYRTQWRVYLIDSSDSTLIPLPNL